MSELSGTAQNLDGVAMCISYSMWFLKQRGRVKVKQRWKLVVKAERGDHLYTDVQTVLYHYLFIRANALYWKIFEIFF